LQRFAKYEWALIVLFVLTLPLINPWVRGDGVGYYAFARSMLIEHKLDFTKDWLNANPSFRMGRMDAEGKILPRQYTTTGHLDNHFSVGPAILWSPFLIAAHAGVLLCDRLGANIAANGYSRPYVVAMALGTAFYGFVALFISFSLARRYVPEGWAFLATLGIWFGSSLPVYMYFNPSWSHAHSAFAVALFLWYWIRTRGERSLAQWTILGALGGLMLDVYYMNVVLLLLPLTDSLARYWSAFRGIPQEPTSRLFIKNVVFSATLVAAFAPTLIAKKIIYGGWLNFGYGEHWYWNSPAFLKVCFSSEHGLFSWTPILALAIVGLLFLRQRDPVIALSLFVTFWIYVYELGCYQDWHGISSYGSRFCVGLTCVFVVGLAGFLDWLGGAMQERRAALFAWGGTAILVLWNLGLIFQWGMHLIPERGPIEWRSAAYNQVAVVPGEAASAAKAYLVGRKNLMEHIEQTDVRELRHQ